MPSAYIVLFDCRTDFMTLPFQSVECFLAHVEPVDGEFLIFAVLIYLLFGNTFFEKSLN